MTIDKEEFLVWREHPITRAYFNIILDEAVRTYDQWADLAWRKGNLSEREYAYHVSRVQALEYMTSLEFEDIFEQEDK